ncbi:hypothetical protein GCM10020219_026690 [Nonomuraea dietziae]
MDALFALVTGQTKAPALVLAAVVHAELAVLRPFGIADGVVARAAERLTLVEYGLDPKSLVPSEVGHLELPYAEGLRAYLQGTGEGVAAWVRQLCLGGDTRGQGDDRHLRGHAAGIADGVPQMRRRLPARHTGLPSVQLYSSDRVKPVSTRLPRLVARGCPADVPGHEVRETFLRLFPPHGNPSVQDLYPAHVITLSDLAVSSRATTPQKKLAKIGDYSSTKLELIGQHTGYLPILE